MFKIFYRSSIRNLLKNKVYAGINIFGLAIGIAVCILIFVIIRFETSFDQFHTKRNHIYRVVSKMHADKEGNLEASIPAPVPAALKIDFPQLEQVAPVYSDRDDQIEILDESSRVVKKFKEESGVFFTDPSFFSIFDFHFVTGNAAVLSDPSNVLITKEIGDKYFGDWKLAAGKLIKRNNVQVYHIAGILENPPANSDFQFRIVGAFNSLKVSKSKDWTSYMSAMSCYLLLPENLKPDNMNRMLVDFCKRHKTPDEQNNLQLLQPLSEVHFDSNVGNFLGRTISMTMIRILTLIGIFILVIACVNFINLSTAQAVNRSKEVGVRKVLGSSLNQIRFQFLTETLVIVVCAIFLAILFAYGLLPSIKSILDIPLNGNIFHDPMIIVFLILLIPAIVFLSGFYPAIILSRFNPVRALKSKAFDKTNDKISVRKGLVVLQFIIAQSLIIGTIVIIQQMRYENNQSMGFNRNAILTIPIPRDSVAFKQLSYLKNQLDHLNGIEKYSLSFASPAQDANWYSSLKYDSSKETEFAANIKWADYNYVPTYGLELAAGRNIQKSDTATEFMVNETMLRMLGVKDPAQALNKTIILWDGRFKGPLVGVLKDFHSVSFKNPLEPVLIASNNKFYSLIGIKLSGNDVNGTIDQLRNIYSRTYPETVFEFQFMDEKIANFYREERKLSGLYKLFAAIAILLSCLGLYGLASFMAVQRIKEVGIRKVLGASVNDIIYLFSKEFIILVTVAFVIAGCLSYYFMSHWLEGYAYRINLSWTVFALSAIISLCIAIVTVSSQAIKAAVVNPVKNLRSE